MPSSGSFSAAPTRHVFNGVLLDMDGTIIDSTDAIVKHWHAVGAELGVDPNVILASSHGRRSIDTLQLYDPSKANWEYISHMEGLIPKQYGSDAVEIPGARALISSLERAVIPWGIVTSGTRALMTGWLNVMSLPPPPVSVVAEEVDAGKPDPACYRLGRERIGLGEGAKVLVFEDAPAGVKAGKAAGCTVLALATTHSIESVQAAGADYVVRDLRSVRIVDKTQDGWAIEVNEAWNGTVSG